MQIALLCLARLQLCSLIEAATAFEMPASARFSHGSWHICQNTPSALNIYISEVFLLFSGSRSGTVCWLSIWVFWFTQSVYPPLVLVYLPSFCTGVWRVWVHTITCAAFNWNSIIISNLDSKELSQIGAKDSDLGLAFLVPLESSQATCPHLHEMSHPA